MPSGCDGSTTDYESVRIGSTPVLGATMGQMKPRMDERRRESTKRLSEVNKLIVAGLAEIVNEMGLRHQTVLDHSFLCLYLYRERPRTKGLLNFLARTFSEWQAVLYIKEEQVWYCKCYYPHYLPIAEQIRTQYYEKLKGQFTKDFVIVE